jgi:hypothetical protein
MKGTIHQKEISTLYIYIYIYNTLNTGAPIYIKEKKHSNGPKSTDTPLHSDSGRPDSPLSPIDRSSRKKINKDTSELLDTLDQIDVVDIYRVFHPTTRQYTFFSAAHGTFSKIGHILVETPVH